MIKTNKMNIEDMQALYGKARKCVVKWLDKEKNKRLVRERIAPKYLKDLKDLELKNDTITLIWSGLDYENYKICVRVFFLGQSGIELVDFHYIEDMNGNQIENKVYFFKIFD